MSNLRKFMVAAIRFPHHRDVLVIGAMVGGIYLLCSASSLIHTADQPEETFVLKIDAAVLYAPQALIDFTKGHPLDRVASHEQLASMLKEAGLERVWIGITSHDYEEKGQPRSRTFASYPALEEEKFRSVLKALILLKTEVFHGELGQIEPFRVVVPPELIGGDPMEAISILDAKNPIPQGSNSSQPMQIPDTRSVK